MSFANKIIIGHKPNHVKHVELLYLFYTHLIFRHLHIKKINDFFLLGCYFISLLFTAHSSNHNCGWVGLVTGSQREQLK